MTGLFVAVGGRHDGGRRRSASRADGGRWYALVVSAAVLAAFSWLGALGSLDGSCPWPRRSGATLACPMRPGRAGLAAQRSEVGRRAAATAPPRSPTPPCRTPTAPAGRPRRCRGTAAPGWRRRRHAPAAPGRTPCRPSSPGRDVGEREVGALGTAYVEAERASPSQSRSRRFSQARRPARAASRVRGRAPCATAGWSGAPEVKVSHWLAARTAPTRSAGPVAQPTFQPVTLYSCPRSTGSGCARTSRAAWRSARARGPRTSGARTPRR